MFLEGSAACCSIAQINYLSGSIQLLIRILHILLFCAARYHSSRAFFVHKKAPPERGILAIYPFIIGCVVPGASR
ncbi:hypothetical protein AOY92_22505 [Escherichia coli]|nr:hypothetical protein AOY92_22505 [Escherichia coli]